MRAMLLAAGRGQRLRPATDRCPKPLLEAGGRSLLEYHLRALAAADIVNVVINTSWLGEQIVAAVGDGDRFGLSVRYSDEGDHALETAGGIANALPLLGDEPFVVISADIWCDYPYARLVAPAAGDSARLVLVPNPAHNADGDFAVCKTRVRNDGSPRVTFSGIACYRPEFFAAVSGHSRVAPLLRAAAARDEISGELFEGDWYDVGTAQRLAALDTWLRA